jgi:hypothetical protein
MAKLEELVKIMADGDEARDRDQTHTCEPTLEGINKRRATSFLSVEGAKRRKKTASLIRK